MGTGGVLPDGVSGPGLLNIDEDVVVVDVSESFSAVICASQYLTMSPWSERSANVDFMSINDLMAVRVSRWLFDSCCFELHEAMCCA
jgi:hypothetical protein